MKTLKALVWPFVLYGCQAWTRRKSNEKRVTAAEMRSSATIVEDKNKLSVGLQLQRHKCNEISEHINAAGPIN